MSNETQTQEVGQLNPPGKDKANEIEDYVPKKLVCTRTAAKILNTSTWLLYQNAARLPGVYRLGRALRWSIPELLVGLRAKK